MRTWLTRAVLVALVALGIAAALEALISDSREEVGADQSRDVRAVRPVSRETGLETENRLAVVPACTAQQLALSMEVMDGSPFIALAHVWGNPCRLARLPIDATVRDGSGTRVRRVWTAGGIAGEFSPDFVRLLSITYLPTCDQREPFVAFVNVGPYSTRGTLPRVGCMTRP